MEVRDQLHKQKLLFQLVSEGNFELTDKLLSEDPFLINSRNEDDDGPLHIAATKGYYGFMKLLISYGCLLDSYGCSSRTALQCAVIESHLNCVQLLLANGASLDDQDSLNENVFHKAASTGNVECMSVLLRSLNQVEASKLVNTPNVLGYTALHNAGTK